LAVDGFEIPGHAVITVSAEDTDVVTATIQLYSDTGAVDELSNVAAVYAYLSDDSGGAGIAATAPDGGIAIGTDGVYTEIVSGKAGWLISEADGDIDIEVTESGTDTFYLVLVLPSGRVIVSDALTFAA
jgi:hypothetical protein